LIGEGVKYLKGDGVEKDGTKALELFQEAYEISTNAETAIKIGSIYLKTEGCRDYEIAETWMARAAKNGSALGYNTMAMFFACNERASLRDGALAVKYAKLAVAESGEIPWVLDTLASAYARNGQFDLAIATQETAYALAKKSKKGSSSWRSGFKDRLNLFKKGKAYPAK
jgi:TPR repeat protein